MIWMVLRIALLRYLHGRWELLVTFVVPIVFFSVFAAIFDGQSNGGTPRVTTMVVDADGSPASRDLADELGAAAGLRLYEPGELGRTEAEDRLRQGEAKVVVVIPAGFGAWVAGEGDDSEDEEGGSTAPAPPEFDLLADTSDPVAPQVVGALVQQAAMKLRADAFRRSLETRQASQAGGGPGRATSSPSRPTEFGPHPLRLVQATDGDAEGPVTAALREASDPSEGPANSPEASAPPEGERAEPVPARDERTAPSAAQPPVSPTSPPTGSSEPPRLGPKVRGERPDGAPPPGQPEGTPTPTALPDFEPSDFRPRWPAAERAEAAEPAAGNRPSEPVRPPAGANTPPGTLPPGWPPTEGTVPEGVEAGVRPAGFGPGPPALLQELALSASMTPAMVRVVDVLASEKANPVVSMYAAGIAVMFLLFGAVGGAGTLLEEEESGTLERLLATRLTMARILIGKWLFLVGLGVLQVTLMFAWGQLVFGVDWTGHLPGFFAMTVPSAAAASSIALVMATACRTRTQLNGVSVILILSMSALGGSMVPRYVMSESMQELGRITFNAWALDGYTKVFWRDLPVTELGPEIGVLLLSAVVGLALARGFARRWETL